VEDGEKNVFISVIEESQNIWIYSNNSRESPSDVSKTTKPREESPSEQNIV